MSRALAAALLLAVSGGPALVTDSAESATPPLLWRDASALQLLCVVASQDTGRDSLQRAICDQVRQLAQAGAPYPVTVIAPGDPALLSPGAVTLLVHASTEPRGGDRLLAFSIRPFRNATDDSGPLFGAAPRAVLVPASADAGTALEAPLRAALAEVLPWLSAPDTPRRIDD